MKPNLTLLAAAGLLCLLATTGSLPAAPDLRVRMPSLDADGRFWVYRNGPAHPPMPFSPYGWMSDVTNLTDLIQIDLECSDHPNPAMTAGGTTEPQYCTRLKIKWNDATWASVAFISGPDKPPWWGENSRGRHYNLSSLARKKLVYYARGEHGGEVIKTQIGMLGDKACGDSLHQPIISDEVTLTTDWVRHEIDLKDVPGPELEHICNGFGVILERSGQPGTPSETTVYLDDIYFE